MLCTLCARSPPPGRPGAGPSVGAGQCAHVSPLALLRRRTLARHKEGLVHDAARPGAPHILRHAAAAGVKGAGQPQGGVHRHLGDALRGGGGEQGGPALSRAEAFVFVAGLVGSCSTERAPESPAAPLAWRLASGPNGASARPASPGQYTHLRGAPVQVVVHDVGAAVDVPVRARVRAPVDAGELGAAAHEARVADQAAGRQVKHVAPQLRGGRRGASGKSGVRVGGAAGSGWG